MAKPNPSHGVVGRSRDRERTATVLSCVLRDAHDLLTTDEIDEIVGTALGRWPHGGHCSGAERALGEAARYVAAIPETRDPFAPQPAAERGCLSFRLPQ